ncbi:MAG: NAD(P)-dependent oxidoreductase [Nitrososphaeraceae archaeon]
MKIGIVGLGLMGSSISLRLINQGFQVAIYNRTISKTKSLEEKGAEIFGSPKEIADNSDFLITCVTDFDAINKVCFQENGIQETDNTNVVVADFSTLSPTESALCSKKFNDKNISMLSSPVMGGPNAALEGHLIPIVSGNLHIFNKVKDILEKLGNPVFYIGNKDGSANAVKLALNLNIGLIAMAFSEGLLLSDSYEIDSTLYLKIFNSTNFKTGISENKGPRIINNDFSPSFYLKNMRKDLGLALDAAKEKELSLPVTSITFQLYNYATTSQFSDFDYSAIYKFLKKLNSLE